MTRTGPKTKVSPRLTSYAGFLPPGVPLFAVLLQLCTSSHRTATPRMLCNTGGAVCLINELCSTELPTFAESTQHGKPEVKNNRQELSSSVRSTIPRANAVTSVRKAWCGFSKL
ncbi:hypothetical protein BaRGS_00005033 [Batillaria attramentaria]|uniref:Secreted protein n=1 Tax=Batillaria attramentaria TaxID=370345 RepID=A0ABD0LXM1_9CAEN